VAKRWKIGVEKRFDVPGSRTAISLRINLALLLLIAIVSGFALPGLARAQSDQTIYADALANGWQNWSWATVNLTSTQPVQAGNNSISVSATAYQALYLHQTPFGSSLYSNLVFWINGGATGGQLLEVQATLNGIAQTVVALPALAANTWQQFSIPLSSLGVQSKPNFDGFWIQDRSGTTQPTFYVDTISLKAVGVPSVVNIGVSTTQTGRTVDARMFGLNAAVWDGVFDTPTTINLLDEMGNQALRFPGGSLSDDYHWATNTTDSNTWQWATSFTQFAQVATATGAQVFITVNYGSGTPAEAAGWVKSANVTNHFGFKYWEIGNENYGSWEADNNVRPHDPYAYAQRFKDYYTQMKAVDPTIKIGAVAITGEDSYANYTDHPALNPRTGHQHNGWTPVMLATMASLGVTPDFLIYHRYPEAPGAESDQGLLTSSGTWVTDASDLRQQLNDYLGASAPKVELDCTENNSVYSNPGKQTTSLVNGLFVADSECAAMSTEFNAVMRWDLRNGQETGNNNSSSLYGWRLYGDYGEVDSADPAGPADRYPTFYVAKLLQNFTRGGDHMVTSSSDYTLLSVCAAKGSNGKLALLVINKNATSTLNANITISGALPSSTGYLYSYGIPQDTAAQTGTGSADVSVTPVIGLTANFSRSFPPYSASVISFDAAASPSPTPTASPAPISTPTPRPTPTPTPAPTPTAVGSVKPSSLSFGKRAVGTTSSAKTVTLSSTGQAALSITGITTTAGFTQTNACGASLPAGKSCVISIRFTPTAKGAVSGSMTINDNSSKGPQVVSLSGTGT
jgi:alpha-N-arabinofuranosidase